MVSICFGFYLVATVGKVRFEMLSGEADLVCVCFADIYTLLAREFGNAGNEDILYLFR